MSISLSDLKAESIGKLKTFRRLFEADVNALSTEQLAASHGGVSRTGFDLIYEITGFQSKLASIIAGSDAQLEPPQGWIRAPKEFCTKEVAASELAKSFDALIGSVEGYQGDFFNDKFASPLGEMSVYGWAGFAGIHAMYHSGQLNYIQTINGDDQFHWPMG